MTATQRADTQLAHPTKLRTAQSCRAKSCQRILSWPRSREGSASACFRRSAMRDSSSSSSSGSSRAALQDAIVAMVVLEIHLQKPESLFCVFSGDAARIHFTIRVAKPTCYINSAPQHEAGWLAGGAPDVRSGVRARHPGVLTALAPASLALAPPATAYPLAHPSLPLGARGLPGGPTASSCAQTRRSTTWPGLAEYSDGADCQQF